MTRTEPGLAETEHAGIDRRHFLVAAAVAAVGALGLPRSLRAARDPEERLAGLLDEGASARAVGRAYLRGSPAEAYAQALCDQLARDTAGGRAQLGRTSDAQLRLRLRNRVRRDFAEERVVSVQGWVLSLTEARLCALTSLRT